LQAADAERSERDRAASVDAVVLDLDSLDAGRRDGVEIGGGAQPRAAEPRIAWDKTRARSARAEQQFGAFESRSGLWSGGENGSHHRSGPTRPSSPHRP